MSLSLAFIAGCLITRAFPGRVRQTSSEPLAEVQAWTFRVQVGGSENGEVLQAAGRKDVERLCFAEQRGVAGRTSKSRAIQLRCR